MKYRKKPVVVEAEQYVSTAAPPKGVTVDGVLGAYVVTIHLQRAYLVLGDWVIAEPDGEHYYPCKAEIFEATYELVGERSSRGGRARAAGMTVDRRREISAAAAEKRWGKGASRKKTVRKKAPEMLAEASIAEEPMLAQASTVPEAMLTGASIDRSVDAVLGAMWRGYDNWRTTPAGQRFVATDGEVKRLEGRVSEKQMAIWHGIRKGVYLTLGEGLGRCK